MLDRFRMILDEKEKHDREVKRLGALSEEIKRELLSRSNGEEVDRYSNDSISVTFTEQRTVKCDPELVDEARKKLIEDGYGDVLYKGFSASKLHELYLEGYRLPEGVTLGAIPKVNFRRKSGS